MVNIIQGDVAHYTIHELIDLVNVIILDTDNNEIKSEIILTDDRIKQELIDNIYQSWRNYANNKQQLPLHTLLSGIRGIKLGLTLGLQQQGGRKIKNLENTTNFIYIFLIVSLFSLNNYHLLYQFF